MENTLQYVLDAKGNKSSVLVSLDTWEDLNNKYNKLLKKVSILTGIQKGLEEIAGAKKSGRKLQTLKEFLNERNG